jgi:hypothetical protein
MGRLVCVMQIARSIPEKKLGELRAGSHIARQTGGDVEL